MYEDRIALLLDISGVDMGKLYNSIDDDIRNIQNTLMESLKISITAVVSDTGDTINSSERLYKQSLEAFFYRLIFGHKSIIHTNDISEYNKKQYIYPENKERKLINELRLGRTVEAKNIIKDIIRDVAEYSYMSYNLAISHLTFALSSAFYIIQDNGLSYSEFNINMLMFDLNYAETLDNVCNCFYEIFDNLALKINGKRNSKYEDLVNRIVEIINNEYMNQNLSLNSIADSMGMSPTYIGRLFKKYTMKTILDCIIEVRMDKAKELLLNTRYSINEVSVKAGFTNSTYFYKAFKKYNGVTPGEYRKNSRYQINKYK
ncbi:MAG TPA: hypothetical protein DD426_01655 [Clostridiaceae bacterium]|nr:hypothetical protein [Clostridiaceae bacterium]